MYGNITDLKLRLRITTSNDDALLTDVLTEAAGIVDSICGHEWPTGSDTLEYSYGTLLGRDDRLLFLNAWLDGSQSVTVTNGDGDAIAAGDFTLWPDNATYSTGILLDKGASESWDFGDANDSQVTVEGTWVIPDLVVSAAYMLAIVLYKQMDLGAASEIAQRMLSPLVGGRLGAA